jgi:DNA-binding transcriptional MerR regulator
VKPANHSNRPAMAKYTMAIAVMMTGTPAHKIRKYEEAGLCKPARSACQQRLYTDQEIDLILRVSRLEDKGVNLAGIRIILDLGHESLKSD